MPKHTAAPQPDTELPSSCARRKHQVNGSDKVSGTYRVVSRRAARIAYGLLSSWRRPPVWLGTVVTGGLAMLGSDTPMALLRVSDPWTWSRTDWISDAVPHLAYGR